MSISFGKVGIAPGTTTLSIGRGGSLTLVGHNQSRQDPGVTVRNAYGELMGGDLGYFDARPTDFEQAYRRGYLPVQRGWMTGRLSGGLGEEVATRLPEPGLDPVQEKAIAQMVMNQLTLEEKALELKERRSRRLWGAIAGMAAGTTALVAVLSYFKKV